MNGITCRNCRTVNPLGSKFCNNCGTQMPPQTTQTCANCGMANPQNRLYCDNCGHRLGRVPGARPESPPTPEPPASTPGRHGFVLPSRRPGDTGELDPDDLPEWLKTGERPSAEPDPERQSRITDWLQELTELKENEDPDRLTVDYGFLERPKWPGRERPMIEEEGKPGELVPDDFFQNIVEDDEPITISTDWLKSETPPDALPAELPTAAVTGDDSWLSAILGQENNAASSDITDDWLNSWEGEPSAESTEPEAEASFGDWAPNFALEEEESPQQPEEQGQDISAIPADWLAELELPDGQAEEAETNSWDVSALAFAEPLSETKDSAADWKTAETEPTDLPDWLAEQTMPPTAEEDETTPDWLADFALDQPTSTGTTTDAAANATPSLLNWLDDLEPVPPTILPPVVAGENDTTFADTGAPLPDWLNDWREDTATESSDNFTDWASQFDSTEDADLPTAITDDTEEESAIIWPEQEKPRIDTGSLDTERTAEEIDLSSWLQELESEHEGQAEADLIAAMPLAEDDLPQWWTGELDPKKAVLSWAEEEPTAEPEPPTPESLIPSDVPDWLAELRQPDTTFFAQPELEAPTESAFTEPEAEEETPGWLGDLMGNLADAPSSPVSPSTWEPTDHEVPAASWSDYESDAEPMSGDVNEAHELVRGELPQWLQQSLSEGNVVATAGRPLELTDLPLSQGDLPEWLSSPADQDFDSALEAALTVQGSAMVGGSLGSEWVDLLDETPPTDSSIPLERADIPEWIQELRPRETAEVEPEPEQITGPLTGMRGVIPVEPIIAQPKTHVATAPQYTISKEQQQQAVLLQQLVHSEAKTVVQIGPKRGRMALVLRLGLAILLLLTVIVGLLLPILDITLPLTIPAPTTGATAAQQAVAAAGESTVLVAFEYTPSLAGELDPQAQLILDQLTATGKQIVVVSQYGAGIGQAQSLGTELAATQFIPGEAIGLRSLAGCLADNTGCNTIWGETFANDLSQVGLIVVLTGERESLLAWVEQVGASTDIPLVVGTTQALAPVAQPYYGSGQIAGLIAGLSGAAAYEQALTGQTGAAATQLQAQLLAQLLILVIFIIGAAYYGLTGQRRA